MLNLFCNVEGCYNALRKAEIRSQDVSRLIIGNRARQQLTSVNIGDTAKARAKSHIKTPVHLNYC